LALEPRKQGNNCHDHAYKGYEPSRH
jgi:hypothetical protein